MRRNINSSKAECVFTLGEVPTIDIPEIKLRYISPRKKFFLRKISTSKDVVKILRKLFGKGEIELQEQILVLYLNNAKKVIGYYRHSIGGLTGSVIDMRLILGAALKSLSTSIVLCHNHPSGITEPSTEDRKITSQLREAAKQMQIELLDHIILTKTAYYSFADEGFLNLDGIPMLNKNTFMKTPITYYGGKQTMAKHLLTLIPAHKLYCEPFFGGGALFFAKPKSEVEVINDIDGEVVNFYKVAKLKFAELDKEVKATLHSRELFKKARVVYENPEMFSDVKRAWAFWTLTNQGFAGMITSWGFGKENSKESSLANKREAFSKLYAERLEKVQIEANDALKVIDRCDAKDTFFYIDPPYFNSDQGHYGGYTKENYIQLLERLGKIKGKFLLSSYPSDIIKEYMKKYKWKGIGTKKSVAVTKLTKKKKVEILVHNYDLKTAGIYVPEKAVKQINVKEITSQLKRLKIAA